MPNTADDGPVGPADRKEETIVNFAVETHAILYDMLQKDGISEHVISEPRVRQLSERLYRDLHRLGEAQEDSICITKVAGYWGFWIRKIRPIVSAYAVVGGEKIELPEINERIALQFAVSYVRARGKRNQAGKAYDPFRAECKVSECDGTACVSAYCDDGLSGKSRDLAAYAVHCMRYRTFGPHHFVMFLDQLIIGSCFAYRAKLSAGLAK